MKPAPLKMSGLCVKPRQRPTGRFNSDSRVNINHTMRPDVNRLDFNSLIENVVTQEGERQRD